MHYRKGVQTAEAIRCVPSYIASDKGTSAQSELRIDPDDIFKNVICDFKKVKK